MDLVRPPSRKRQKSRHRASVACVSCRDRRTRVCSLRSSTSTICADLRSVSCPPAKLNALSVSGAALSALSRMTTKEDGVLSWSHQETNAHSLARPISRAYMASLMDRVALLENMLREKGTEPPPANHPPKIRTALLQEEDTSPQMNRARLTVQGTPSPGSQQDDFLDVDHVDQETSSYRGDDVESAASPPVLSPPRKEGMVKRLLSTRGHLSFDQLSLTLRYYGPTTNCHVHSELGLTTVESGESSEQARRAEKIIRFLSLETHEYLMDNFWQHYNSVLHVLHKDAFYEDREHGKTQFYSPFLHICVLAMGYRTADKSRPDMQTIALPQKESTLHREAKFMLECELERTGAIPSIIALLLLGDLECGVGRDNLGWLYSGMAMR